MAEKGIIKNSTTANEISATDFASIFNALIGDQSGILDYRNKLKLEIVNNNTVRLLDGVYSLKGFIHYVEEDTNVPLTIESGTLGMNRIDAVVSTYHKNGKGEGDDLLQFEVVRGEPVSGTPSIPVVENGDVNASGTKRQEILYTVEIVGTTITKVNCLAPIIQNISDLQDMTKYLSSMDVGGIISGKLKRDTDIKLGRGTISSEALATLTSFGSLNYSGGQILGVGTVSQATAKVQRGSKVVLGGSGNSATIGVNTSGWYKITVSLWLSSGLTIPAGARTQFTVRQGTVELYSYIDSMQTNNEYKSVEFSFIALLDPSLGVINLQSKSTGFNTLPVIGSGSGLNNSYILIESLEL